MYNTHATEPRQVNANVTLNTHLSVNHTAFETGLNTARINLDIKQMYW